MNLPDVIFSNGFDYALAWTVLHAIWQVTLIAFLTGIVLIALRRKSSQARYLAANMGLLASLLAAVLTFSWYMQPVPVEPMMQAVKQQIAPAEIVNKGGQATETAKPSTGIIQRIETNTSPEPTKPKGLSLAKFQSYFNRNLPLLVLIWFMGMAVFLLKLLGGLLQTYDLRRHMNFPADPYWSGLLEGMSQKFGFTQGIALLESALVRSPATIGHLRPLILFPIGVINRLSEQEVEAILAHELAHILRRDYLFNILQSVVEALFYFHPAIWWISSQVRNEREHACDDKAVALLGSKINYAKALVAIQEMAFYPQTMALAFAGNRKSQLMRRVQRLFSQPTSKINNMEKGIATAIVICIVFVLALGQGLHTNDNLPLALTETQDNAGLWEAEFDGDSVHLTLSSGKRNHNWIMGDDFATKDFDNLKIADGKTQFEMSRPAGKMTFRGEISGKTGYGRFEFVADEAYRSNLTKQGINPKDDQLVMLCFYAGFPMNYVDNVEKMGIGQVDEDKLEQLAAFRLTEPVIKSYQDMAASVGKKQVDVNDIVQMKVSDVSPEKMQALSKAGYGNLDLDDLTAMSLHGVDAAFIEEIKGLGLGKLSGEDLLSAKIHGISASKVQEIQSLGLGKLNFDDIMSATIHGIDADFVHQVKAMGIETNNFDDVMAMKIHGIDPAFVTQAKSMGLGDLDQDDIMSMKIHGIDEEYVQSVKAMGFADLSLDDIMSMKIHGIDADFVKKANSMGFGELDMDQLMTVKIHGIDQAYINQLKSMGFATDDLDEVMTMKVHNINTEFVNQCKAMDIGAKTADDFMQLKVHGITAAFVKSFRDLKLNDITVDDITSAKIHGVTPEFIKEAEKKGYRFPNLEEYVDLKVRDKIGRVRTQ